MFQPCNYKGYDQTCVQLRVYSGVCIVFFLKKEIALLLQANCSSCFMKMDILADKARVKIKAGENIFMITQDEIDFEVKQFVFSVQSRTSVRV